MKRNGLVHVSHEFDEVGEFHGHRRLRLLRRLLSEDRRWSDIARTTCCVASAPIRPCVILVTARQRQPRTGGLPMPARTAIVTGSTSGIGEGIARALAAAGNNIVLNGFGDAAAIEKIRSSIEKDSKVKCLYVGADMTRSADIEAMFKQVREALGPVDIVVNNAGVQHVSPVEDFPVDKWNLIINLNRSEE